MPPVETEYMLVIDSFLYLQNGIDLNYSCGYSIDCIAYQHGMVEAISALCTLKEGEWETEHDRKVDEGCAIELDSDSPHHLTLHDVQLLCVISEPESLMLGMYESLPYPDGKDNLLPQFNVVMVMVKIKVIVMVEVDLLALPILLDSGDVLWLIKGVRDVLDVFVLEE